MTIISIDSSKIRSVWRDVLEAARAGHDTVIEHYNRPTAAVIPYEDFLALQEELDDLRAARRAEEAYAAWQQDPSRGRDWEEVKAELIRDGLLDG